MPPESLRRPSQLRGGTPRYRFDAPGGEYAVLYVNYTQVAAFNETYAERLRRLSQADAARHLLEITPQQSLSLVDLTDDRTLTALSLDARISVGDDYKACHHWARAFHEGWPEARGISYAARWGGVRTSNVALFVERCRGDLAVTSLGSLGDLALENLVLEAVDRYNLTATFLV